MQIIDVKLSELKPYNKNAKKHPAEQVQYIANSLKQFGWKQPIVIDKDNVIVCGHGRMLAAESLGWDTAPCVYADDLNDEQIKAFRLADNKTAESDWDIDFLEIELGDIFDIDMTDFGFASLDEDEPDFDIERKSLTDRFVVPPFSVLDARQGYWNDRKRQWINAGLKSMEGRDAKAFTTEHIAEQYGMKSKSGTSVFDPVLTEVMYKWFCVDGGAIYDPFAGGSVRGIVADKLGYSYTGIDLRQEQVDANYENASEMDAAPVWYCDDSLNADKYIQDGTADMVFTCPPYADLEKYSDLPNDISNMPYEDFCKVYADILRIANNKLKDDRFFVVVIGDVRDKDGAYRQLVDYTRKVLTDIGLCLYNDMVLIEPVGTGAIRAPRQFNAARKVIKTHQNVLVFYKGNMQAIKDNYTELDYTEEE